MPEAPNGGAGAAAPRPPPLDFPPALRQRLGRHPAHVADALAAWFSTRLEPAYLARSSRVGKRALRPGLVGALLGRKPAPCILAATASKLGGTPYLEAPDDWPRAGRRPAPFLGQLNFSDLPTHVPGIPECGILALYLVAPPDAPDGVACRWYPHAAEARVAPAHPGRWVTGYEAALSFEPFWELPPGDGWEALLDASDPELWELILEWKDAQLQRMEGREDAHKVFGHPTDALLEALGDEALRTRRSVLRLTYDHAADLGWGSNALYVLADGAALASGRLEALSATLANA